MILRVCDKFHFQKIISKTFRNGCYKVTGAKENVFCILDAVKVCKTVDSHRDYRDVTSCIFTECSSLRTTTPLFCIKS